MEDLHFNFNDGERAAFMAICQLDGFKAVIRAGDAVAKRFQDAVMEADPANRSDVLAKQARARAIRQFWQVFIDTLNREAEIFNSLPTDDEKPLDPVEAVLA